jgi:signal transduction histidine kinase
MRNAWRLGIVAVRPAARPGGTMPAAMSRALLGFFLLLWAALAAPAHAQTLTLRSALSAPGAGAAFPVDVPAQAVSLPDEWAHSRPGFDGTLWYRVVITGPVLPGGGDLLALAIERVCSNFEVQLNGQRIASGGRMSPPYTHNCNHPQLIALPPALLRAGANTLDIQVAGHRRAEVGSRWRAGGLSALVIGPQAELEAGHARQRAWTVDAAQGASVTLLLLGGFLFGLGFIHRHESHLAYFGALAIGVALYDTRLWLRQVPLEHHAAEFLLLALLGFIAWVAVQFLLRYAGARLKPADVGLPLQCAAIALSMLAAGPDRIGVVAGFWHAVLGLEVAAAALYYLWRRRGTPSGHWMAVLLAAVVLAAALEPASPWSEGGAPALWLAPLVLPLALAVLGLRLLLQHGRALQLADQGQGSLEQRVLEAAAEIERNFRQLAELKVEQVTERERKRIAADLHDDLGAKLLTIVHTSESERISTLAREALEEMRLSVRGLTGKPVRLADAMGDWRAETISRLSQAGIEGEWSAPEDLPQPLSSRAYVQTTRILREATSNIIKHSRATHCAVICAIADGDFQLVIQDNGEGIAAEVEGRLDRGHGLASMKNRAKQLHGQCLVESGPGYGTVIRLTLPLGQATGPG